ncbi:hypothetical protein [Pseudodesulfovibrio piezophilus]|uniref:TPM domain-containing protein n=1 Tax=Pseudodesulfovibrio piezophilus (strain DSM 21447 / JCM 15486 / C1TLV30) TaxID=1322246 RepID=M1WKJ0_PSEP2|nr:hypothetical protein [Pseudodesulfovibrio piezophilus]CCH49686.1 conserved exported protein of unknown function [Pseudodesulfovibrio piezophilus C1TLV30]
MRLSIPKVHANNPKEKIIRTIAMLLVFAAVIWAFTKNNERVVDMINQQSSIYDETKTLDKEQKKFILSFTRTLKDEFGLECKIQIYGGDFVVPELDRKTMYIGLAPSINEVQLRFPGLMRQALGADFIEQIRTEHFLPSFEYNDWPEEIKIVLLTIFDRLSQVNQGTTPSE